MPSKVKIEVTINGDNYALAGYLRRIAATRNVSTDPTLSIVGWLALLAGAGNNSRHDDDALRAFSFRFVCLLLTRLRFGMQRTTE